MRPIEVSMTTLGPLGWIMAAAVACGASGRSGAGAGVAGGVVCWATASGARAREARTSDAEAADRVEMRNAGKGFMPCLGENNAGRGGCQRRAGNLYCIEMKIYRNQTVFRRTALAVCALFCLGLAAPPLVAQAGKDHGGEAQAGGDQAGADKAAAD